MDTPAIGTTTAAPGLENLQAPTPKVAARDTAQPEQVAAIQAQDRSTATVRASGPAPVSAAAAKTGDVSLSNYLSMFRKGDAIDLDGPMWFNGTGKILTLDADHLKLTTAGKIGTGTISLDRKAGDTFTATVVNDGKTTTYTMKATQKGNKLDFVDVNNKENALHFNISGKTVNLNPDGFGIPGSVDITKK